MFAALLVLASSTIFLVEDRAELSLPDRTDTEATTHYLLTAFWTASTSLSVVIVQLTAIALLNYPLDKPQTLVVNSRYARLAPRVLAIVIVMCLPLIHGLRGTGWCGASTIVLWALFLWEWLAGLEKNWKFFEGKDG